MWFYNKFKQKGLLTGLVAKKEYLKSCHFDRREKSSTYSL